MSENERPTRDEINAVIRGAMHRLVETGLAPDPDDDPIWAMKVAFELGLEVALIDWRWAESYLGPLEPEWWEQLSDEALALQRALPLPLAHSAEEVLVF